MAVAESAERRRHFRGKPRPGRQVAVEYRVVSGTGEESPPQTALTHNIGVGGAFIVTPDPAPPGSEVRLAIAVPGSPRPIAVKGEVRWIADDERDDPQGMGVRFQGLGVEEVLLLNEYFATLTRTADLDSDL